MKRITLISLCLILAFADTFAQTQYREVSGIYAGGHIRRGRPNTITKLRHSGFTYLILFNVDVKPDGTLTTDGDTICYNGEYVFQKTRTSPTSRRSLPASPALKSASEAGEMRRTATSETLSIRKAQARTRCFIKTSRL